MQVVWHFVELHGTSLKSKYISLKNGVHVYI